MNSLDILANIYKQELADANEQKVLFKTQCELYKQEIAQLKEQLKRANERIADLEAEDKVEQNEAEIVE